MTPNDMLTKAYNNFMASNMSQGLKNCATEAYNKSKLIMNSRLRVAAGKARCSIHTVGNVKNIINPRIEWNPTLFQRMTEDQQYNTISHEFAHIVEFFYRGDSDHGVYWQMFHRACGGNATTRHNYDTTGLRKNVKRRVIFDTMSKKEYRVTENTFNRIVDKQRFILMKTETYNGGKLVACHNHAIGA